MCSRMQAQENKGPSEGRVAKPWETSAEPKQRKNKKLHLILDDNVHLIFAQKVDSLKTETFCWQIDE